LFATLSVLFGGGDHSSPAGRPDRVKGFRLPGAQLLWTLRSVLRTAVLAVGDALGVAALGAANDVVAHTGQVLHTATADHHDGVFLQVVAFAGDVRGHLKAVRKSNTRNLAQRRVGLLGGRRGDTGAHA